MGDDLVKVNWATTSLESWTCMIRLPRLQYDDTKTPAMNNITERSRALQRRIYQKLAEQRGL